MRAQKSSIRNRHEEASRDSDQMTVHRVKICARTSKTAMRCGVEQICMFYEYRRYSHPSPEASSQLCERKERAKTSGADTTGTGREAIGLAASEEVCMMVESKGVREYGIRM